MPGSYFLPSRNLKSLAPLGGEDVILRECITSKNFPEQRATVCHPQMTHRKSESFRSQNGQVCGLKMSPRTFLLLPLPVTGTLTQLVSRWCFVCLRLLVSASLSPWLGMLQYGRHWWGGDGDTLEEQVWTCTKTHSLLVSSELYLYSTNPCPWPCSPNLSHPLIKNFFILQYNGSHFGPWANYPVLSANASNAPLYASANTTFWRRMRFGRGRKISVSEWAER